MNRLRIVGIIVVVLIVIFVVLQIFPIGSVSAELARHDQSGTEHVNWSSPEVEQLVRTACYDCHSDETRYPWYSTIAPVSWLVNKDVNEGRRRLNFSETPANRIEADELVEQLRRGTMPPQIFKIMHSDANLTDQQIATLENAFQTTFTGRGEFRGSEGAISPVAPPSETGEAGEAGEAGESGGG